MQIFDPTQHHPTNESAFRRWIANSQTFLVDLKFLLLEQMLEVRTIWHWFLIFSLMMPFAMLFGFTRMGSGLQDQRGLLYIVSGSAIFAAANDGLTAMAIRIGTLRRDGAIVYYASLPISKIAFIMALIISRLMLSLPGMILPILVAPLLYPVQLKFTIWIIPLIILTALALSTVGMAIGVVISSLEMIHIISNALLVILLMAAPLFIPLEALPKPLRILSYALPPSYAADALRYALAGSFGTPFFIDIGVLSAMTLGSLMILPRWLQWQIK
jgi:ABC-2 type transport system permease protein